MPLRACLNCKMISDSSKCPNCGGEEFTSEWVGEVFIFNPEASILAKIIGARVVGRYAVRLK
ncbi:MAG: transcription elongation factor subunit Spt4 [Thermoproteota archaeon]